MWQREVKIEHPEALTGFVCRVLKRGKATRLLLSVWQREVKIVRRQCAAVTRCLEVGDVGEGSVTTRGQAWLDVGYGEPATLEHPEALTGLRLTIHPLV